MSIISAFVSHCPECSGQHGKTDTGVCTPSRTVTGMHTHSRTDTSMRTHSKTDAGMHTGRVEIKDLQTGLEQNHQYLHVVWLGRKFKRIVKKVIQNRRF